MGQTLSASVPAADSGLIAMGDPAPNCLTSTLRRIQAPSFFSVVSSSEG